MSWRCCTATPTTTQKARSANTPKSSCGKTATATPAKYGRSLASRRCVLTQPPSPSDPIAKLQSLADTEASRRASQRAANRMQFPGVAMICDQVRSVFPGAQFVHGEEGGREIGKRPALPVGVVEID